MDTVIFFGGDFVVRHIVCFKLADNSEAAKKEAAQRLLSMKGKGDLIKEIEVGTDFLGSQRSYDVILQVVLESREAIEAYQKDEYHCSYVKTYMHEKAQASVSVDYEF